MEETLQTAWNHIRAMKITCVRGTDSIRKWLTQHLLEFILLKFVESFVKHIIQRRYFVAKCEITHWVAYFLTFENCFAWILLRINSPLSNNILLKAFETKDALIPLSCLSARLLASVHVYCAFFLNVFYVQWHKAFIRLQQLALFRILLRFYIDLANRICNLINNEAKWEKW